MDWSTYMTPLKWNGLVPCYIYKASKGPNPSLQMEERQEAPVKSTAGMYCCKVCDKSFSRKDNLFRHLLIHSEKKFQCHHCQNVTVGKRNWKSTKPVTTEVRDRPLCNVHIVWNISPEIIHWSLMSKCAWKNPLVQQNLIWKAQCSNWYLLKNSIVRS